MGFVYALRNGTEDLFKIGETRGSIEKRRRELSTGIPIGFTASILSRPRITRAVRP
jgi:hypothetical protein